MATCMPESELLRRALVHLDQRIRENPGASFSWLLDQTAMQFNLSPMDATTLERLCRQTRQDTGKTLP